MKRIKEFEKKLAEQINTLEGQEKTDTKEFSPSNMFLSAEGAIRYTYYSLILGCEIEATYKGFRYYGNDAQPLKVDLICKFRDGDE
jgi:hypothetical protein